MSVLFLSVMVSGLSVSLSSSLLGCEHSKETDLIELLFLYERRVKVLIRPSVRPETLLLITTDSIHVCV